MNPESIGRRIARLRQARGWSQQTLADRVGISRVAVSHIEMDLTIPGERTIALLAGLFKRAPHDLVDGSTYPLAKAERLPAVVCCHTDLELKLALLQNDLEWLARLADNGQSSELALEIRRKWLPRLTRWAQKSVDETELALIASARQALTAVQPISTDQEFRHE